MNDLISVGAGPNTIYSTPPHPFMHATIWESTTAQEPKQEPVPSSTATDPSDTTITTETENTGLTFLSLPLEIREMVWRFALPERRAFKTLVWVSVGLKMQLLNRSELKLPLAHVCFEARRIVKDAGYALAFRDEDEPDDPGVWFNPGVDRIERTIWGPGDWSGM